MTQGGLFKWSVDEMVPSIRSGGRYMLMLLYALMALVFFIAVVAYGAANSVPILMSSAAFMGPVRKTTTNVLDYPAITVCPTDLAASVSAQTCMLQLGSSNVTDCSTTVFMVTVPILGVNYPCVQYNGGATPVQATSTANSLLIQTGIDSSNSQIGAPTGAYVIVHSQRDAPELEESSFVATPGFSQMVLLRNSTTVTSTNTTVEFQTTVSKMPLKGMSDETGASFDMRVVYPQLVSYIQQEATGTLANLNKGRFITEAGGLAALLLFLHRFVMWVTAFPMFLLCKARDETGARQQL